MSVTHRLHAVPGSLPSLQTPTRPTFQLAIVIGEVMLALQTWSPNQSPSLIVAVQVAHSTQQQIPIILTHDPTYLQHLQAIALQPQPMAMIDWEHIRYGMAVGEERTGNDPDQTTLSQTILQQVADTCGHIFSLYAKPVERSTRFTVDAAAEAKQRLARLTPHQQQIVALMMQGLDVVAIAQQMAVAVSTVRTHQRRIFARLDLHDARSVIILGFQGQGRP